jgi:pimeloyl-ACP methyl ester carboxylesterase
MTRDRKPIYHGMTDLRKYGSAPYGVVVVHGGPGVAGGMKVPAIEISKYSGVLEPLQTGLSIDSQLNELHATIRENAGLPVTLIGHSWGAWLSFLYASRYTDDIRKIVLIGAGPFDRKYVTQMTDTRMQRLNDNDRTALIRLWSVLNDPGTPDRNLVFKQIGSHIRKADFYCPLQDFEDESLIHDFRIYNGLWPEADKLRNDGLLLRQGLKIRCPVTAIHGDYDPHPVNGVKEPLEAILSDFKIIILEKCGHEPWNEAFAREKFYDILLKEL